MAITTIFEFFSKYFNDFITQLNRLEEKRCSILINNHDTFVYLKINWEEYCRSKHINDPHCDWLVIKKDNKLVLIIIELKSGSYRIDDVVKKMQSTLIQIEKVLMDNNMLITNSIVLYAILLKKRTSKGDLSQKDDVFSHKTNKLIFIGKPYRIFQKNCGDTLSNILMTLPKSM